MCVCVWCAECLDEADRKAGSWVTLRELVICVLTVCDRYSGVVWCSRRLTDCVSDRDLSPVETDRLLSSRYVLVRHVT